LDTVKTVSPSPTRSQKQDKHFTSDRRLDITKAVCPYTNQDLDEPGNLDDIWSSMSPN